jgi:hypothetical protein
MAYSFEALNSIAAVLEFAVSISGMGGYSAEIENDAKVIYQRGSGHSAFSQAAKSLGEIRFFSPFCNRMA